MNPIIDYEWYIKDIIYIGINKIENDDGLITVLEECKSCIDYQYDDETLDDMIDYFGF